ncbi:MAG TPA: DUF4129 domain-containing protein [Streptosporangiaceae bacterium]|jgi:hypothetical protein
MRRAAAALLLVAVAAVGLRAGGAFSAAGSQEILGLSGQAVYWTLAGAEVILGVAGIVLLILRMIWGRRSGKPLRRQRRSLWWLLLLPLMVFALARILRRAHQHAAAAAAAHGASVKAGPAGHLRLGNPWPLLVLFAFVALAAAALTVYRRRRAVPPPPEPDPEPDAEPLVAALAAGARVLHEDPDPRTAIIGCYAAMERSLADAGSPPRMADTPAEVLSRATASGLVRSAPATTLTSLFRRARYSSHPMTEADRAAAIDALAQVRADLDSGALARADVGGDP